MPLKKTEIIHKAHIDNKRRRYVLMFVCYITSAIMILYGLKNIQSETLLLPVILFGTALAFCLNILWFHFTKNLKLACFIEALFVSLFVIALVFQGGYNDTALYWVFPFPAILFGLLGIRYATAFNLALFFILAALLLNPDMLIAQYKDAESSRFLASLLIVMAVSYLNELFHERSYHAWDLLQKSKDLQANTDSLTQLANRRFIDTHFTVALSQEPEAFLPLGIVMCDIDHFKAINDNFGHSVGDEVLLALAEQFRMHLRQQDFACRSGGEEFLLLLPKTHLKDTQAVAEKIRKYISEQKNLVIHGPELITASFGVALCTKPEEFNVAIKEADERLYQSKRNGRNQVS